MSDIGDLFGKMFGDRAADMFKDHVPPEREDGIKDWKARLANRININKYIIERLRK